MSKLQDLTGRRFGKYVVIGRDVSKGRRAYWYCQCDCGSAVKSVAGYALVHGIVVDCGCGRSQRLSKSISHTLHEIIDAGEYMYFETHGHQVLFDKEDADVALSCRWGLDSNGYCRGTPRASNGKSTRFHRAIMSKYYDVSGLLVDHINGDRDDNRKSNLRLVTYAQNSQNSQIEPRGKYLHKGVYHTKSGKWCVQIRYNDVVYNLGTYENFGEACRVREKKEMELFGEYSRLSVIDQNAYKGGII